jgi:methionine-rich copper-binding protein CopC
LRILTRTIIPATFAACAAALLTVSGASAHAAYKSSTPAKGEVLSASPAQVSIAFTQEVQKVTGTFGIDVADAGGASMTPGDASLDDGDRSTMTVALNPNLGPGRYVVRWKNVSDVDGEAAEGAFSFYVETRPSVEDLAADQGLTEIGAEEEPPGPTSGTSTPSGAATEPPPPSTAVAPPTADGDGGGDGGNSSLLITAGVIIAAIALGFAGARLLKRRRA